MRVINVYDKDEQRAGDIYSGPSLYFDWPFPIETMNPKDPSELPFEDKDVIFIFGGGGMLHIPFPEYDNGRFLLLERFHQISHRVILWGLGHNVHGSDEIAYPDYIHDFAAVGVRDWNQGLRWVPCVSCMHEAFGREYKIEEEIRAYRREDPHDWWPFPFDDHPMLEDAKGHTLDEIAMFLAGAETIVTNSYHGTYWSMLLGRKVVVHKPFSSKFYGLTEAYEMDGDDMVISVHRNYLERCRKANEDFYMDVINLIRNSYD